MNLKISFESNRPVLVQAPFIVGGRQTEEIITRISNGKPRPSNRALLFHLPFAVLAPDGFAFEIVQAGTEKEITEITVSAHPNHVFAVKVDATPYQHKLLASSIAIDLYFCHVNHLPANYPMVVTGKVVWKGDSVGKLSHTTVLALFPVDIIRKEFSWDSALYCDLATDAVNRFVEHYRLLNDVYKEYAAHAPRVTAATVSKFVIITQTEDKKVEAENYVEVNGMIMGAMNEDLSIKLKKTLENDAEPDIIESLHVQIRNYLLLKEWRLAIIESAILFETWIQPIIRNKLRDKLKSNNKVSARLSFIDNSGRSHPMPMGDILKSLIEEEFNFPFQQTVEYINVTSNTISPRNKIVHGNNFKATKDKAEKAYQSAKDAIQLLRIHIGIN